ncbi:MAG: hypothetical protein M9907_15070 [Burkholderiaceae bacterium]|nr:hypothetical protein [Burkholderiaceae bacterium]
MCTERRSQRGQALVETLVAALVLVPLALLAILLGKYQSMQQASIAASRTLAFECTVRPGACADAAAHAQLADDVRRRHFGRIDREILSNDVVADPAPPDERNPLWADRRGRPLLERFADVGVALAAPRFDAGRSTAVGRAAGGAASLLDRLAGPARFGLSMTGGLVDALVQVRVSPSESDDAGFARLDSMPLTMRAHTVVLSDAWNASGPYGQAAGRVEPRVEQGSRLDPVHQAQIALGYQLTQWTLDLMHLAGLEPSAGAYTPQHVDVDRVPADRIAP